MSPWIRRSLAGSIAASTLILWACSDPPRDPGNGNGNDTAADGVARGPDASSDPGTTWPEPDFLAAYTRIKRTVTPGAEPDLIVAHVDAAAMKKDAPSDPGQSPLDPGKPAFSVTSHSLTGGRSCRWGCLLSDDARHLAVAKGAGDKDGFDWELAALDAQYKAHFKGGVIEDAADLHFGGGFVWWSTARNCLSTGKCQYRIMRRSLKDGAEDELVVIAPDGDPDVAEGVAGGGGTTGPHTTYDGRFTVGRDGSTLVFIATTIRSARVYAWRGGKLLQLDYLCKSAGPGPCVGDGSEFSDNDPVAITDDGKVVALFFTREDRLEVRRYDVTGAGAPTFSVIAKVPPGSTNPKEACLKLPSWGFGSVRGQPAFSADGQHLLFVGVDSFGSTSCAGDKPRTEVFALRVDAIGAKLKPADIVAWTTHPHDATAEQLDIRALSRSPQGSHLVLAATARTGTGGGTIATSEKRHTRDTELYAMQARAGGKVTQVSNETLYAVLAPEAVSLR